MWHKYMLSDDLDGGAVGRWVRAVATATVAVTWEIFKFKAIFQRRSNCKKKKAITTTRATTKPALT